MRGADWEERLLRLYPSLREELQRLKAIKVPWADEKPGKRTRRRQERLLRRGIG